MNFLMRLIVTSIVAFGLSYLLGGIHLDDFWAAILLALVLAFLNAIVKPLLIFITLPITFVTLGLFLFVINAIIILFADNLIDGFTVDGFWWALLFSLLLSIVTSLLYKEDKKATGRKELSEYFLIVQNKRAQHFYNCCALFYLNFRVLRFKNYSANFFRILLFLPLKSNNYFASSFLITSFQISYPFLFMCSLSST